MGKENPTRNPVLGILIRNGLSGTVDCWHCLMTLLFMTSQCIPLHYLRRRNCFQECYEFEKFILKPKIFQVQEK